MPAYRRLLLRYLPVQNYRLHRPFVPCQQCRQVTQRRGPWQETVQPLCRACLTRVACSVAWELSCLVCRELRRRCVAVSAVCVAESSSSCSTRCTKLSWRLQLRCGFQFPWRELILSVQNSCVGGGKENTRCMLTNQNKY